MRKNKHEAINADSRSASLMSHRASAGGATTNTSFVTKRQVTPEAPPEVVDFGGVFLKNKCNTASFSNSLSLGFHPIVLKLGRMLVDQRFISKTVSQIFVALFLV